MATSAGSRAGRRLGAAELLPEVAITDSGTTLSLLWRTGVWYDVCMEAFVMPDARERVDAAVDALVDESIDDVSTHALGHMGSWSSSGNLPFA
jgi:hypothetical protein